MDATTTTRQIDQPHCQSCGSTRPESISDLRDTEGYTRCCNQRVVWHTDPHSLVQTTCSASRDCYHD